MRAHPDSPAMDRGPWNSSRTEPEGADGIAHHSAVVERWNTRCCSARNGAFPRFRPGHRRPRDGCRWRSLSIGGVRIRLFGIDTPEGKQTCEHDGRAWACGEEAARQLRSLTATHEVRCEGHGDDAYGRAVAVCSADGFELNKTMVEAGWATAMPNTATTTLGPRPKLKRRGSASGARHLIFPAPLPLSAGIQRRPRTYRKRRNSLVFGRSRGHGRPPTSACS